MKRTLTLLIVVLAIVAGACGSEEPLPDPIPLPDPGAEGPTSLDGAWVLVAGVSGGRALDLIEDYRVTMTIDGASIGGRAACNSYGGTVTLTGGTFALSEMALTAMGCEPDVTALESAFMAALTDVNEATRSADTATLTGEGVELTFALLPPVRTAELVGTTWILDTLIDGEVASSTHAAADVATLRLDPAGSVTGSTGCRTLAGDYVVSGDTLQFPNLGADGECPPDLQSQDSAVISVLEASSITVEGGRLTLTAPGGEGLSYRAEE